MEPLEQAAILLTLMKRLGQVMDHERALLHSMRLDDLQDLQEEKAALTDAYEIELKRIRTAPETMASLEPNVREQLESGMRRFQEAATTNMEALAAAQTVVDKVIRTIADSVAVRQRSNGYGPTPAGSPSGQVISVAFDRKL
jgi:flagellar biosynthesis/type III secretory pathway chaperone